MKTDRVGKHFLWAFTGALLLYFGVFYLLEYLRTHKGGWDVTFRSDSTGSAALQIQQRYLGISNVVLEFPGSRLERTNFESTVRFDQPLTNVPFGKVVYLDTTFLPGAVVFELFGHEVQLLPRVLMVDRREIEWHSGTVLHLTAASEPKKSQ